MTSSTKILCAGLLLTLGLVLPTGCSAGDKAEVERVVRDYAELLPSVYERSEPSLLSEVATETEQNRVLMYLLYLKQQKQGLDTRLLELEIASARIEKGAERAIVTTNEVWDYRTVDSDTGVAEDDYIEVTYESEYVLLNKDGKWRVSEVDIEETSKSAGER